MARTLKSDLAVFSPDQEVNVKHNMVKFRAKHPRLKALLDDADTIKRIMFLQKMIDLVERGRNITQPQLKSLYDIAKEHEDTKRDKTSKAVPPPVRWKLGQKFQGHVRFVELTAKEQDDELAVLFRFGKTASRGRIKVPRSQRNHTTNRLAALAVNEVLEANFTGKVTWVAHNTGFVCMEGAIGSYHAVRTVGGVDANACSEVARIKTEVAGVDDPSKHLHVAAGPNSTFMGIDLSSGPDRTIKTHVAIDKEGKVTQFEPSWRESLVPDLEDWRKAFE